MADNPGACGSCGRPREQVPLIVSAGAVPLCSDCIRRYGEALARAIDDEARRRAGPSESAMAEELALNLMDALDASRAADEEDWNRDPTPQPQVAPEPSPESQPEPEPEPAAEPPPPRRTAAVIPARFASSRFPGKPLHPIAGRPMVQHVWERCVATGAFDEVLVATDDARIVEAVEAFGGVAVMTSPYCKSGTDRVAEIAQARPELTHLVNVQGDEPLVEPEMLASLAGTFEDPDVEIATLVRPLEDDERTNPNVVKVVLSRHGDALYFSRADIPFQRDPEGFAHRYAHIGLYAYTRRALLDLARHPSSPLEETEKLEQLRALELGFTIRCLTTLQGTIGVDTPDDAARAEERLRGEAPAPEAQSGPPREPAAPAESKGGPASG